MYFNNTTSTLTEREYLRISSSARRTHVFTYKINDSCPMPTMYARVKYGNNTPLFLVINRLKYCERRFGKNELKSNRLRSKLIFIIYYFFFFTAIFYYCK